MQNYSEKSIFNRRYALALTNTDKDLDVNCKDPHEDIHEEKKSSLASLELSIYENRIVVGFTLIYVFF